MSLPYQIEETLPEGGLLEGGRRKGEEIHNNMHFHRRAQAHTHAVEYRHKCTGGDAELSSVDKQMTDK